MQAIHVVVIVVGVILLIALSVVVVCMVRTAPVITDTNCPDNRTYNSGKKYCEVRPRVISSQEVATLDDGIVSFGVRVWDFVLTRFTPVPVVQKSA